MKNIFFILLLLLSFPNNVSAQTTVEPWNANQLMQPKILADRINQNKLSKTIIVNIGPDATIKNSFDAGAGKSEANVSKLLKHLEKYSKKTEVILYCGCCPFNVCPNIRPAFKAVQKAGFSNLKLLNIPKNIKVDWIDKGYPVK